MSWESLLERGASALRSEFDRGFADAPVAPVPTTAVLAVRVGGARLALPRAQLAAVHVDLPLVHLPSRARGLLGVIAVRGAIVPVWDLGVLAGGPAAGRPRWLALSAAEPAALAFDELVGHVAVPASPSPTDVVVGNDRFPLLDLDEVLRRA